MKNKKILWNDFFMFITGMVLMLGIVFIVSDYAQRTGLVLIVVAVFLLLLHVLILNAQISRANKEFLELVNKISTADFPLNLKDNDTPVSPAVVRKALAELSQNIQQSLNANKDSAELQNAILHNLNEGVIATDINGKIRLETPLSAKILGSEPTGATKADAAESADSTEDADFRSVELKSGVSQNLQPDSDSSVASVHNLSAKNSSEKDQYTSSAQTKRDLRLAQNESGRQYIFLRSINYNHVWELMERAAQHNTTVDEEIMLTVDNESRIIRVFATPLDLTSNQGILAVLRDVTQVKQLENIRRDFVANVSHEIKTPLTSIIGYIDLLTSKPRKPEEIQQSLEIIGIEAERLQSLISDLLDLSEIEQGDRQRIKNEPVYVYEVADEVATELSTMAENFKVKLHVDVDPDFVLQANYTRIKQLLSNLVSNAIKYNIENGDVWMRSETARGRNILIVEDNGIGISEEDQERIFERFYRVNKSRSQEISGTGLGLSIVKHIANLYGGSVEVYSELGRGTKFVVSFPLNLN